jgi:XTP/dITP diphosphohydrolase
MIEGIQLLSLKDIGFDEDIPEPFHTFEENAFIKASLVHRFCGKNVFADDSGICVNALEGNPGVDSAHYSGARDDEKNLQKILDELKGKTDRSAFYKAVICLIWNGEVHYFDGVCTGHITEQKKGTGGFGYDPVFIPDGYDKTFAELPLHIKNALSHRGKAIKKMLEFLNTKI